MRKAVRKAVQVQIIGNHPYKGLSGRLISDRDGKLTLYDIQGEYMAKVHLDKNAKLIAACYAKKENLEIMSISDEIGG